MNTRPSPITSCPPLEMWCAYEDGALSEPERQQLQAHLAACLPCFRTLTTIHKSIIETEEIEPVATPPALLDRMLRETAPSVYAESEDAKSPTLNDQHTIGIDCPLLETWCAYEDGALSEPERQQLQSHLASCLPCFRTLATIHKTVIEVEEIEPVATPPALLNRMLRETAPSLYPDIAAEAVSRSDDVTDYPDIAAAAASRSPGVIDAVQRFLRRSYLYAAAAVVLVGIGSYIAYRALNPTVPVSLNQLAKINAILLSQGQSWKTLARDLTPPTLAMRGGSDISPDLAAAYTLGAEVVSLKVSALYLGDRADMNATGQAWNSRYEALHIRQGLQKESDILFSALQDGTASEVQYDSLVRSIEKAIQTAPEQTKTFYELGTWTQSLLTSALIARATKQPRSSLIDASETDRQAKSFTTRLTGADVPKIVRDTLSSISNIVTSSKETNQIDGLILSISLLKASLEP